MESKEAVEVLRIQSYVNKHPTWKDDNYISGKNIGITIGDLRKACLALEKQILLLTKAKNRIDLLDKEKIDFLDNKENREIYLIMNRQERIVWQEVREVLENGKQ